MISPVTYPIDNTETILTNWFSNQFEIHILQFLFIGGPLPLPNWFKRLKINNYLILFYFLLGVVHETLSFEEGREGVKWDLGFAFFRG